jgi:hypothetical protein
VQDVITGKERGEPLHNAVLRSRGLAKDLPFLDEVDLDIELFDEIFKDNEVVMSARAKIDHRTPRKRSSAAE